MQHAIETFKTSTLEYRAYHFRGKSLRALWRLHNPFVSTSKSFQHHYRVSLLRHFLGTNGNDWTAIAAVSASALQAHFQFSDRYRLSIPVKDAVRNVALAASLKAFFGIEHVDHLTLEYIGTEIHELVLWKKCFDSSATSTTTTKDIPTEIHDRVNRLITTLRQISPDHHSSPLLIKTLLYPASDFQREPYDADFEFNPMNLIMPAFESPWRAVLYTLLAVLQKSSCGSDYQDILTLRNSLPNLPPSPAAIAIARESLRLYPPVRRVLREQPVDVEQLHRDERYWGRTALEFRPSRFLNEDGSLKKPIDAWMPFAAGSMRCPAAVGFSERMIVTVTGEILRQIFPKERTPVWYLSGKEWDDSARRGEVLRGGRQEYSNVMLHVE